MKKFILGTMIASVLSLSFTTQKENYDFLNSLEGKEITAKDEALTENAIIPTITVGVGAVLFVAAFTCPTWAASTAADSMERNETSFSNRHNGISEEKLMYNLD